MRHYEIRWLSLHACVNRIIEQWDALKLYFHHQYLLDRNLNAEFLQTNFDDNVTKVYFLFLDYVLPIINKFNTIFQSAYCAVHRLYRDMVDNMYKSLLSCYMKAGYVTSTTVETIDPKSEINFLELNQIYFGVMVAKLMSHMGRDLAQKIQDFIKRCRSF